MTESASAVVSSSTLRWQCSRFYELSLNELYDVMRLRQLVFVVEQNCAYVDADGYDAVAMHLLGWSAGPKPQLNAYARLFAPGVKYDEAAIGRVVTHPDVRASGLGRALMHEAIARLRTQHGDVAIRLSAQRYLERFYNELGFVVAGEPYDEDGIPHIEMVRSEVRA